MARSRKAASKDWKTHRKQLPDYDAGVADVMPAERSSDTLDLATELPVSRLFDAGNIADWPDPVYDIDPNGFQLIHNCFPVIETMEKRGCRIAKLNWSVIGDGPLAKAIGEIFDQIQNWVDLITWLNWADIDGVRFMQMKTSIVPGFDWVVPDFFMGGRKKFKAGGDVQWNGRSLVQVRRTTGVEYREARRLPQWQFLIHRPGAGSNPEGEGNIAVAVYRIARAWEDAMKNTDAYMELFGLPIRVFKGRFDRMRPTDVPGTLLERANRLKTLKQNKQLLLDDEEVLELIEPKGQGFKDMVEYAKYLEGLLDQLFLANVLTSKVDDARRTGNTLVHMSEEAESIYAGAMRIAATLNRYLLPWILRKNPDLPDVGDNPMPYFWPEPPVEDHDSAVNLEPQSITSSAESGEKDDNDGELQG